MNATPQFLDLPQLGLPSGVDLQSIEFLLSYVPRHIVHRLSQKVTPISQRDLEHFEGAVMLADISGFTALTERLGQRRDGAEVLTKALNDYFTELVAILYDNGGDVVKFAGDAIICMFPVQSAGDTLKSMARRATQCALQMLTDLYGWESDDADPLSLHVSIGTGSFVGLHIGGVRSRWDFTLHGTPLDQIGVCEKYSVKEKCMVSKECWELINDSFLGTPVPDGDGVVHVTELTSPSDVKNPWDGLIPYQAESALRRYVNPLVMGFGDAGQNSLDAEFRTISVLFIKLQGVDTSDEDIMIGQLDDALRIMQKTINYLEGVMLQFRVDEKGILLIAAYGLPGHAHEDDATRAGMTARQISKELKQYLQLGCGIGITTGRAFCGSYGAPMRRDYSMMGNIVNTSARLMSKAQGEIICDELTVQRSGKRLSYEQRGEPVELKGIARPVQLYRLVGAKTVESDTKKRVGPKIPLVGRTNEVLILENQLEILQDPSKSGSILVISADPGMGKSQLAAELEKMADQARIAFWTSSADAVDRTQYMVMRSIINQVLGIDPYDPPIVRVNEILQHVVFDMDLHQLAPLLNDIFDDLNMPDSPVTESLTKEPRQQALHSLLLRLVEQALQWAPKVIVLENATLFDESSWKLIHKLAELKNILLVITTRPIDEDQHDNYAHLMRMPNALNLRLTSMTVQDTQSIIAQRLGVRSIPTQVLKLIMAKAEGNPFFAEEMGLALRDQKVIVIEKGRCSLAPGISVTDIEVPANLRAVIISRIDRLSPTLEFVVKICAIIGERVLYNLLHDVYPIEKDRSSLLGYLNQICELDLLVLVSTNPRVYQFKHSITKSVVYDTQAYSLRRTMHRSIARWYEQEYPPSRRNEVCTILANHWHKGENLRKAVQYREMAGEGAYKRWAHQDCIRHFTEAVALDLDLTRRYKLREQGISGPGQLMVVPSQTSLEIPGAGPTGRPGSGRPASGRPGNYPGPSRPGSGRPGSGQPRSGTTTPVNVIPIPIMVEPAPDPMRNDPSPTPAMPNPVPRRGRRPSVLLPQSSPVISARVERTPTPATRQKSFSSSPSPIPGRRGSVMAGVTASPRTLSRRASHNPLAETMEVEDVEDTLELVTDCRKAHWHTMMSKSHYALGRYFHSFSEAQQALVLHGVGLPTDSKWVLIPKTIGAVVGQIRRRLFDVLTTEKRKKERNRKIVRLQMFGFNREGSAEAEVVSSMYEEHQAPIEHSSMVDLEEQKLKLFRLQELEWLYDIVGRVAHSSNDKWLWQYCHLQSLNVAEELADLPGAARGLSNISLQAAVLNHTSIARTYLDHAEASADFLQTDADALTSLKPQLYDSAAYASMQMGRAYAERCNFDKAMSLFLLASAEADDINQSSLKESIRFNLGLCHLAQGQFTEAARVFKDARSSASSRQAILTDFQSLLGFCTAELLVLDGPEHTARKTAHANIPTLLDVMDKIISEVEVATTGRGGDALLQSLKDRKSIRKNGIAPSEMMWACGLLAFASLLDGDDEDAFAWAERTCEHAREHSSSPLQSFAFYGLSMCASTLMFLYRCALLGAPKAKLKRYVTLLQFIRDEAEELAKRFHIARPLACRIQGFLAFFNKRKLRLAKQRLGKSVESAQLYRLPFEEAVSHFVYAEILDASEGKQYKVTNDNVGSLSFFARPLQHARVASTPHLHRLSRINTLGHIPNDTRQAKVISEGEVAKANAELPGRTHRKRAEFLFASLGALYHPFREVMSFEQLRVQKFNQNDCASSDDSGSSVSEDEDVVAFEEYLPAPFGSSRISRRNSLDNFFEASSKTPDTASGAVPNRSISQTERRIKKKPPARSAQSATPDQRAFEQPKISRSASSEGSSFARSQSMNFLSRGGRLETLHEEPTSEGTSSRSGPPNQSSAANLDELLGVAPAPRDEPASRSGSDQGNVGSGKKGSTPSRAGVSTTPGGESATSQYDSAKNSEAARHLRAVRENFSAQSLGTPKEERGKKPRGMTKQWSTSQTLRVGLDNGHSIVFSEPSSTSTSSPGGKDVSASPNKTPDKESKQSNVHDRKPTGLKVDTGNDKSTDSILLNPHGRPRKKSSPKRVTIVSDKKETQPSASSTTTTPATSAPSTASTTHSEPPTTTSSPETGETATSTTKEKPSPLPSQSAKTVTPATSKAAIKPATSTASTTATTTAVAKSEQAQKLAKGPPKLGSMSAKTLPTPGLSGMSPAIPRRMPNAGGGAKRALLPHQVVAGAASDPKPMKRTVSELPHLVNSNSDVGTLPHLALKPGRHATAHSQS